MRRFLLLIAAFTCFPGFAVLAMDSPFRPEPTPAVSEKIQVCEHLVLAKWVEGEKTADQQGGSSKFEIVEIGFSRGDRFRAGQVIEMPGYISGPPTETYALMGRDDRTEGWYSPLEISADAWNYISNLPLPTTDPEAHAERLSWFFKYLEHPDPLISADAFAEISAVPYDLLMTLKDRFPREKILTALVNPKTPATRISYYGLMAGHCGRPEDAAILEKKIVEIDADHRHDRIAGVMTGYLLIRGEEGLQVLEDKKMRARVATNIEGKEVPLPFSETYASMMALRFMWVHEPNRMSKERLSQSMRVLLEHQEFADLVIAELRKWKDWSVQEHLMAMYKDENVSNTSIRRSVIMYLHCCSQERITPGKEGGPAIRPEYAVKAEANLKILEEQDPTTFDDVRPYLIEIRTEPTDAVRPAPILENAEALERTAKASSHGLLGCGTGVFQFVDHSGRARRIFSGLDPIHVFGEKVDAETLSMFLESRARANEGNEGPMNGERRFLLVTIVDVVKLSEDARFIDLLAPLLGDPTPAVRASVQSALLCIADRNVGRRTQVLEMLNKHGWSRFWLRGNREWIP